MEATEIQRLTDALHENKCHPDYEYVTVVTGRKSEEDDAPDESRHGTGWEENVYGDDFHSCWERFKYTEESYWRRLKTQTER